MRARCPVPRCGPTVHWSAPTDGDGHRFPAGVAINLQSNSVPASIRLNSAAGDGLPTRMALRMQQVEVGSLARRADMLPFAGC